MGRFEADKGLIHMTFANEDRYFKNSLVCLNLRQNLYYELRQKDYNAIYFINLSGEKYHLTFGNEQAAVLFNNSAEKGLMKWLKKHTTSSDIISREVLFEKNKCEELLERILLIMKQEKRVAVVFSVDAFATFQGMNRAEQGFLEVSANNYSKNNLLLIVAPTAVDGSLSYFSNPNSIYRSKLFPAIQNIFKNYRYVHLYKKIKNDMPNRVSYMNTLDVKELENMIRYTILNEELDVSFSARDYAECIWYLYHSTEFCSWVKDLCADRDFPFPVNRRREYSVIEESLKQESCYRILNDVIVKIREMAGLSDKDFGKMIPQVLHLSDYSENNQQYLFWNNDILQRIETLSGNFLKTKEKKNKAELLLTEIRKNLSTPFISMDDENTDLRTAFVDFCIEQAMTAAIERDEDTFLSAIEALHYGICVCEEDAQRSSDIEIDKDKDNIKNTCILCYRKILECQKAVFDLKQDINQDNLAFRDENNEKLAVRKEIERMEKEFPDLPKLEQAYLSNPDPKQDKSLMLTLYQEKKIKVRNLTKSLKGRKQMLEVKYSDINQMENAVRNMEVTIAGLSISKGKWVRHDLDDSLEIIQSVFDKVNGIHENWSKMEIDFKKVTPAVPDYSEELELEEFLEDFDIDEEFFAKFG